MDWSKAKNILIIALIAADLFMGLRYADIRNSARKEAEQSAVYMEQYLKAQGVELKAELTGREYRLPVVFVSIEEGEGSFATEDGKSIDLIGAEGFCAVPVRNGDGGAAVISSSDAAAMLMAKLPEDLEGLEISAVELVYLVDRSGMQTSPGEDTAVPAWRFDTSAGPYYIQGFAD